MSEISERAARLLTGVTPWPWAPCPRYDGCIVGVGLQDVVSEGWNDGEPCVRVSDPYAALIAAATELAAEVVRLEAENADLRARLSDSKWQVSP